MIITFCMQLLPTGISAEALAQRLVFTPSLYFS